MDESMLKLIPRSDGNSSMRERDYGLALLNADGGWFIGDVATDHQEFSRSGQPASSPLDEALQRQLTRFDDAWRALADR